MGYYQDKKRAIDDILLALDKKTPIETIYYKIMVKYGFGKEMVNKVINTTQEFIKGTKK